MAMNTNLLNALKEIVSRHGGVETLADARRVKALLADLAAKEPKPQKNALVACIEQGFAALLQNVPTGERGPAKAKLAKRLNREEGLEPALCADTLDLLEAALFGAEKNSVETTDPGSRFCTACGAALPGEARFCPACGAAVAPGAASPAACHAPPNAPNQQPVLPAHQEKEVWRELRTLKVDKKYGCSFVAYSPDGRRIVSLGGGTIKIWDAETGWELQTLKVDKKYGCSSVAYSPGGHGLASAMGKTIKIWDAETGRELYTLRGHTDPVGAVAYSPDGRRIVSVGTEIKIWDAETGRELNTFKGHTSSRVRSVAYNPDGRRIASLAVDDIIRIWDVESGRELQTLKGYGLGHTGWGCSVAYNPDGRRILAVSVDGTIKIWDAESGQILHTLTDESGSVAYSPDGRRIVSGSYHQAMVDTPDGPRVASTSHALKIWDAESGRELQTLKGHTDFIHSVAYSPNGRRIASCGSYNDNTVRIWGVE
jgi:WD40 repeat protein